MKNIEAINRLTNEGYVVLQAQVLNNNEYIYLLCHKFTESTQNNVESVEYCVADSIDITSFLVRNSINPNLTNFLSNLNQIVTDSAVMRLQFSKNTKWVKWSSASKI